MLAFFMSEIRLGESPVTVRNGQPLVGLRQDSSFCF